MTQERATREPTKQCGKDKTRPQSCDPDSPPGATRTARGRVLVRPCRAGGEAARRAQRHNAQTQQQRRCDVGPPSIRPGAARCRSMSGMSSRQTRPTNRTAAAGGGFPYSSMSSVRPVLGLARWLAGVMMRLMQATPFRPSLHGFHSSHAVDHTPRNSGRCSGHRFVPT